jgi:asparagine synthase (glutamine-hydrolysing)
MKLQVGLLYIDGRLATQQDLSTILGEYENVPAETSGEVIEGSLAMAYRGDRITCEEDNEIQPFRHASYLLTFDGRLDNRSELARRIGSSVEGTPDPALISQAYGKLGNAAFRGLIGEFALSLWCSESRTLTFARSECGARPLYYVVSSKRLVWCSDFAHLVRISGVDLEVNENYVLEYLYSQPSPHHSPLKHVHVVRPGTALRFAGSSFERESVLWKIDGIKHLDYKSDCEYEEHFRTIVQETVDRRLRAKGTVFSELSGGLDSSTLVLVGDQILRSRQQSREQLQTVSCVYELSPSSDESYFIKQVEDRRGIKGVHLSEADQGLTLGLRDISFQGSPSPLVCSAGRIKRVRTLLSRAGARVLLSGEGGDHVFWSSSWGAIPVADELWRGHFPQMHSECKVWSRIRGAPYWRLLATSMQLALNARFGGEWRDEQEKAQTLLTARYQRQFEALGPPKAPYKVKGSPGLRAQFHRISELMAMVSGGYHHIYRGIYVSFPYTYRPLVEFCLGVPTYQFLRKGIDRSLMRRALRELLPDAVNQRCSKGAPAECMIRTLQRDWHDVGDVRKWELCEREFLRARELSESLQMMRAGREPVALRLFRICSMERWLRSLACVKERGVVTDAEGTNNDLCVAGI